jgi:hypothetical protein
LQLGEAVELVALFDVELTEGVDCVEAAEELLLEQLVGQLPPSKMDTAEGSEQE